MIGKTISHYKILEKLGEGGMGVVYKAEDTKLDRIVALKFLPPHISADKAEMERFIHEAKTASAIEHTNICNIHEIDETDDGQLFIAMAHYEGETLKDRIQRGPLKLEEAIDTAIQVAEGLARAHEEGIVHRDIKPGNIIVTKRDVVKIVDFGLAKLVEGVKLTKTGTTLGTAAYMSPEQTSGKKVDRRSDIWSLGVVLYEMITGQLPFKGEYEQAVSYAIVNEEQEPITALRTGVPMELERIVDKSLEKKPDERYQHVDEMLVDLKNLRREFETPSATSKTKVAETHPRLSLKKLIIPIGAVFILVLAFFMLRSFISEEVLGSAPISVAVIPFENRTGDTQYDNLNIMIQDLLITKLSDSKYMYVSTRERMRDVIKQLDMIEEEIDSDSWFDVCRFDGVEAVVIGSMSKAGDTFVTDVKVLDVESKQLIESASARGQGVASILNSQIDELGKRISRIVGLSDRKIEASPKSVREVTTTSMEAYHYFLRGRDAYENVHSTNAQKFLEMAVELDSTFAMAYRWLGSTYNIRGMLERGKEAYRKAYTYSKKATEKERLYIEAGYASVIEGDRDKRFRILKEIAEKYPKEKRVYYLLSGYYPRQKESQKRIEFIQKCLELDPNYVSALNELAYTYMELEKYDEALVYLKRYATVSPGDPNPFDSIGDAYFLMGNLEESIKKYKEAVKVDPDWGRGDKVVYIHALREEYSEGLEWLDEWISGQQSIFNKAYGYMMPKGLYHFLLGQLDRSIEDFEAAKTLFSGIGSTGGMAYLEWLIGWVYAEKEEFHLGRKTIQNARDALLKSDPRLFYFTTAYSNTDVGFLYLKEGKIDSARFKLSEVETVIPKIENPANNWDRWGKCDYELLRGLVLLEENKAGDAISVIKKAPLRRSALNDAIQFILYSLNYQKDALARAYHQAGNLDKAIAEYERITQFDPNSKDRLLIHPKYHYRLAKLYEEKGLKDKAIEQYEKFLAIWRDADEDLPEPHDARARLARLKGGK
jgi:serine/threonine protein kinase/tetratricopeptide (TPR) repeat protein